MLVHSHPFSNVKTLSLYVSYYFLLVNGIAKLASSVQMFAFEYLRQYSKSFRYNENKRGPRQELQGIPHVPYLFLDFLSFREKYCCLLCRQDFNKFLGTL